jgi:CRP/FNR family transcriptional regulator
MLNVDAFQDYQDGDIIINEGTHGDWVCVVIKGKLIISRMVKGEKVVIDELKEGDILGEFSFIDGEPRFASATAIGEVRIGIFNKMALDDEFNKLSKEFREILFSIIKRLRKTTEKLSA